jgi:hypothetical protein
MSKTKIAYWLGLGYLFSFLFSVVFTAYGAETIGFFDWKIFLFLGLLQPLAFLGAIGVLAGVIFLADVLPDIIDERDKRKKSLDKQQTEAKKQ